MKLDELEGRISAVSIIPYPPGAVCVCTWMCVRDHQRRRRVYTHLSCPPAIQPSIHPLHVNAHRHPDDNERRSPGARASGLPEGDGGLRPGVPGLRGGDPSGCLVGFWIFGDGDVFLCVCCLIRVGGCFGCFGRWWW